MKKLILLFLLTSSGLMAQNIVMVYSGMNLKNAIDTSLAGTVFYVHPGNYGGFPNTYYINKKITIIGMGYFLPAELGGSTYINTSMVLQSASSGSSISGIEVNAITVQGRNTVIERNKITTLRFQDNSNNSIGRKNYITGNVDIDNSNIQFTNNIILGRFTTSSTSTFGCYIVNNTFDVNITGENYSGAGSSTYFKNNILGGGLTSSSQDATKFSYFNYNLWGDIDSTKTFENYGGTNIPWADRNTLFRGWPNNPEGLQTDARAMLAANSPAKGTGERGTDMGAFGGDDPYVLSGVPDLPEIYYLKLQSPVSQGGTMQVDIKAKTNH